VKAFLLAAGLGTRLGELTRSTPKCLLPLAGRPLLDYWFDSLEQAGVTDVLLNVHHLADQVRDYVLRKKTSLMVRIFFESELLGSAGTIRQAWDFVEGEKSFFIVYADNFARVDLRRLYAFHERHAYPLLTLVGYSTDEPQRCGILELDSDDKVISFEEKPSQPKSNIANAGLHVAGAGLYDYLPGKYPADLGFHVLPRLTGQMCGYVTDEYIQDIGTPETYERARRMAEKKE